MLLAGLETAGRRSRYTEPGAVVSADCRRLVQIVVDELTHDSRHAHLGVHSVLTLRARRPVRARRETRQFELEGN